VIVVARPTGGLGNRLFQAAHLIAFGREHGVRVLNPAFGREADCFPTFRGRALCAYPPGRRWPGGSRLRPLALLAARAAMKAAPRLPERLAAAVRLVGEQPCDLRDPRFVELARRTRFLFVAGWLFRDPASVAGHAAAVREAFTPAEPYRAAAARTVAAAREGGDVLVGAHIRRGDFATFMGGRFFFDGDEYARVLVRVRELLSPRRVRFLVCSNEPLDHAAFADLDVSPGPGGAIEDMYALAQCDYLVGPPSTFSGWASFYGRVPAYLIEDPTREFTLADFAVWEEAEAAEDAQ
jgi:hypothetical protein